MTLERLTKITSVGITSGIMLNNATLTGVTTIASLDSVSVGGTITAVNGTFSGNVSIAGTLTYEDVTNVDSVGIITAQSGIHVTGGSVGIGTDNPSYRLHVYSSGADAISTIDSDSGDAAFQLRNSGDGNWSGINFIRERSTGTNVTGGSIWMPSDTSNNSALLYIQTQTASAQAGFDGVLTDNNGVRLKLASQPAGVSADSAFSVEVGSSERLRINSSGNVGINTNNPGTELHVQGTNGYAELRLSGNSGSGGSLEYYDHTTKLADIYADSSSNIIFRNTASNTERFRITGIGGSMGLGTQNPSALLEIDSGGSYGIKGTVASKVGQSKRFIGKWGSGATHNIAIVDGGTPRGQSRLGGFVVTFTYRSMYGFDGDGGGHGVRMLSGRVRDSGEWGFDTETNAAVGDTPVPTLQGTDNSDGTCTIQLVNPSSTHSFGEFNLIVWDCDIISPST